MSKFFLLFSLVLSYTIQAKTYDFSLQLNSLLTGKPLQGISVIGEATKNQAEVSAISDQNGLVIFKGLTEKSIKFIITDPSGEHRETSYLAIYNKKSEHWSGSLLLRLSEGKEVQLIASKKMPLGSDSSIFQFKPLDCDTALISQAEFPGGSSQLIKFIVKNMVYPQKAIDEGQQGRVYVAFVVEEDGSLSNIHIARGASPELDTEAIRLFCYMPKWKPFSCDGIPIRASYKVPLTFSLQ